MNELMSSILLIAVLSTGQSGPSGAGEPGLVEPQLRREDPAVLAQEARRLGDVRRGAIVFYQPALMCVKCHVADGSGKPATLGPDLTAIGKSVSDTALVEAILDPSRTIKKGYETVRIVTDDGRTTAGLLAEERADELVLRDPVQDGKLITIAKSRIEHRDDRGPSVMPAGLTAPLASRQQFLDLVRYLMEIAEFGPALAQRFAPTRRW